MPLHHGDVWGCREKWQKKIKNERKFILSSVIILKNCIKWFNIMVIPNLDICVNLQNENWIIEQNKG